MSEARDRPDKLLRAGGRFLRHLPDSAKIMGQLIDQDLAPKMKLPAGASALAILGGNPPPPWHFDVIQVHFGPMGLVTDALRELGLIQGPVVITFHGSDVTVVGKTDPGRYEGLFRRTDAITVNSIFLRKRLIELGAPEDRVVRLPMGVDPSAIPMRRARDDGTVRLLTVARLSEEKGIGFALDAVALLSHVPTEVHYTVIGEGPLRPKLERKVRALGIQDRVRLMGALPHDKVLDALRGHDLFLFPAVRAPSGAVEAQGRALVEAQAAGLPIVATSVGGIPETVGQGGGVLVPPGDPVALARAVEDLLENPSTWEEMGHLGRCHVEQNFDQRSIMQRLEGLYRSLQVRHDERGR